MLPFVGGVAFGVARRRLQHRDSTVVVMS